MTSSMRSAHISREGVGRLKLKSRRRRSADKRRPKRSRTPAKNLVGIIDELDAATTGRDCISVEMVMDAFENRLFGPLMILPGLILISPLGGIPFLPAVVALFILLIAAQSLFRRKPWVPAWIAQRHMRRDKLVKAINKLKPAARWIDKLLRPRMRFLVNGAMKPTLEVAACTMALLVFPLAPIPFAVQLPAWNLVLIGLARIADDGLVAAFALGVSGVTIGLSIWAMLP
ncbi:MAG: exopolysaccharide biosynthesis protein [Phycisphaeraceae bacterium]|nr:exopolysaccharide biosynthesis protein [Phycisphaeraceae bacterium]